MNEACSGRLSFGIAEAETRCSVPVYNMFICYFDLFNFIFEFSGFLPLTLPRYWFDSVLKLPIPVAEWSKARVGSRSPAEIAGSNPAGGTDVCLL